MKNVISDFTKHLDKHLNSNSMIPDRLSKQHPSHEKNQKVQVALNICL